MVHQEEITCLYGLVCGIKLFIHYWHLPSDLKQSDVHYVTFYQSPLILTALLHVDLINVIHLTACAFIRSS